MDYRVFQVLKVNELLVKQVRLRIILSIIVIFFSFNIGIKGAIGEPGLPGPSGLPGQPGGQGLPGSNGEKKYVQNLNTYLLFLGFPGAPGERVNEILLYLKMSLFVVFFFIGFTWS